MERDEQNILAFERMIKDIDREENIPDVESEDFESWPLTPSGRNR